MSKYYHVTFLITDFRINILSLDDLAPAVSTQSDLEQKVSSTVLIFHCKSLLRKVCNCYTSFRSAVLNRGSLCPQGTFGDF